MLAIYLLAVLVLECNHVNALSLQHVEELSRYIRFGLWWIALGVASSIGLGMEKFWLKGHAFYSWLSFGAHVKLIGIFVSC